MIRLISAFKRKPGTTYEEFADHWINHHGPLVASAEASAPITRYEQHFVSRSASGDEPPYDGVTIQWYPSVESFWQVSMDPTNAPVMEDANSFLDMSTLIWILVDDECNVVIDRSAPPA